MANNLNDQTIIRVQKDKNHPYNMVNRHSAQNPEPTYAARGSMFYLLTKADNWTMRVADLISPNPKGHDHVYSILKELKDH